MASVAACAEDPAAPGDPDLVTLSTPAAAPLRRLLGRQYTRSVGYLLGDAARDAADPPEDSELNGFASIAASQLSMTAELVARYESSARAVAKAAVSDATRLTELVDCDPSKAGDAACYRSFVARLGRLAFRRPLATVEVDRYTNLAFEAALVHGTFESGLELVITSMLQAPSFLFQVELGEPAPGRSGVRALTGYELASRLSFLVLERTPSAELLDAAEKGELASPAEVRAWADELLHDPEARTAARSFFTELLVLDDLTSIAKDPALFPEFSPELAASMREETLSLVDHVLWDSEAPLTELVSRDTTYIDDSLASLYGAPEPPVAWQETSLAKKQGRRGVLTHASILARQAHAQSTSATYRGLFVMERFLCRTMPPPPPDVVTELPPSSAAPTLRDRLAVHEANPVCRACHETADTIGLALENFDAIGRWRKTENGAVIDASGDIAGLGSFADSAELATVLSESPELPHCLLRQMFRHATGHIEEKAEMRAIDAVFRSWQKKGLSYPALVRELAASDLFRHVGVHDGAPPDEVSP